MFLKETRNHSTPYMIMTLKGRFKGENNLRWHCVTLADQTKGGIPTIRWISRILYCRCELEKHERGFLFARYNRRKEIIGDYDPMFRNLLEQGQKMHPKLFTTHIFIGDFSLRISLRCGATREAENNNVDIVAIELINQWSKRESERGIEAGLSMKQVYTQVSRETLRMGRTDKKLTSTLVNWTFFSFELAGIFKSMGVFYFSNS